MTNLQFINSVTARGVDGDGMVRLSHSEAVRLLNLAQLHDTAKALSDEYVLKRERFLELVAHARYFAELKDRMQS